MCQGNYYRKDGNPEELVCNKSDTFMTYSVYVRDLLVFNDPNDKRNNAKRDLIARCYC